MVGNEAVGNGPLAMLVLVNGDCRLVLAPVARTTPCDIELVNRLLWLQLRARRIGWRLRLEDVDDELRGLLDLVGVTSHLMN